MASNGQNQSGPDKYQASPSGGVVATLQRGQAGFNDPVRFDPTETTASSVTTGQVVKGDSFGASEPIASIPQSPMPNLNNSTVGAVSPTTGPLPTAPVAPTPPPSVSKYKVGAQQTTTTNDNKNWFLPAALIAVGAIVVILIGYYIYQRLANRAPAEPEQPDNIVLNYWGLWEPSAVFTQALKDFETQHPGVSIQYLKKDVVNYRADLQAALTTGNGPDLFRYHASWRSELEDQLATMSASVMTAAEYSQSFYPVIQTQLTDTSGGIKGIPLMYDSLALIYNKKMFDEAGIEVPRTWSEFRVAATQLTKTSADGYIEQAGAAMGLGSNIDFFSDIVGLLAVQNGVDLQSPDPQLLNEVLTFYTGFYTDETRRTWDTDFDNSTSAFAREEVAMILAPSWLIHDIFKINPTLDLGVSTAPQLDVDHPTDWATYWVEGVNEESPNQKAAWELLEYLSSEPVLDALYQEQVAIRRFGEIFPRPAMADLLATNVYVQPYLVNADAAVGFPLNDKTFDQALDDYNKQALQATLARFITSKNTSTTNSIIQNLIDNWQENLVTYGYMPEPEN